MIQYCREDSTVPTQWFHSNCGQMSNHSNHGDVIRSLPWISRASEEVNVPVFIADGDSVLFGEVLFTSMVRSSTAAALVCAAVVALAKLLLSH